MFPNSIKQLPIEGQVWGSALDIIGNDLFLESRQEESLQIFLKGNKLQSVFKGSNVNDETAWFDGVLPKRLDQFCETLFDLCNE